MITLTNTPPAVKPWLRTLALLLLVRQRRLVNRWVARLIARRERQAASYALRQFDKRSLQDIGIFGRRPYDGFAAIAPTRRDIHEF